MASCVGCGGYFLRTKGIPPGFKFPVDSGSSFTCPHCEKIWEEEGKTRKIPGLYTETARDLEDYCWFAVWEEQVRRGELSPQAAEEACEAHIVNLNERYHTEDREAAMKAELKKNPNYRLF